MHKSIKLPGRAPQLIESTIKPLITNDQLDKTIAVKKTVSKSKTQSKGPFFQRQHPGYRYSPETAPIQQAAPTQHQPNTSQ
ncbi:hypothetical protein AYI69_g7480 [Smittium culicis]|uniref:Uncharacterized protein n=1 Tax=Smittium culicis TaxID=133412 RepID=A0A1R1XRK8_9FUNG|nr:hypothetical protein AYI69_g7480 [Smittium culicis]